MIEPVRNIQDILNYVRKQINNDNLWKIIKFPFDDYSYIFFLYTEEQVEEYKNCPIKEEWKEKLFERLKLFDKDKFCSKEQIFVEFDCKEVFDNYFKSNWYYYFK